MSVAGVEEENTAIFVREHFFNFCCVFVENYAIITINVILSFINIRKVPREVLKTSGFALGFQHLPRMDELGFYVPSTVFQSFRDDGRVNMKGSVQ